MYVPNQFYYGADSFEFYVQDDVGNRSPMGSHVITVTAQNNAPFFSPITPVQEGFLNSVASQRAPFDVNLNDVDSDGAQFRVEMTSSYGGAFSLNQTFLTLNENSIQFLRGAGFEDPRLIMLVSFRSHSSHHIIIVLTS